MGIFLPLFKVATLKRISPRKGLLHYCLLLISENSATCYLLKSSRRLSLALIWAYFEEQFWVPGKILSNFCFTVLKLVQRFKSYDDFQISKDKKCAARFSIIVHLSPPCYELKLLGWPQTVQWRNRVYGLLQQSYQGICFSRSTSLRRGRATK